MVNRFYDVSTTKPQNDCVLRSSCRQILSKETPGEEDNNLISPNIDKYSAVNIAITVFWLETIRDMQPVLYHHRSAAEISLLQYACPL